jgi:hypothetical protein
LNFSTLFVIAADCKALKEAWMDVDGSCHCGYVKFECSVDPEQVFICHCTDCQQISGSAFRMNAPAAARNLKILSGEPMVYIKHTAESGKPRQNAFCPKCGSGLYAAPHMDSSAEPMINLRVGALRQRDQLPPKYENWLRSAQGWMRNALPTPKNEKT